MAATIRERQRPPHFIRVPNTTQIKVFLAENRMTLVELASELGCNRQHLSSIINGRQRVGPDGPLARKIAAYFEVPIDELFPLVELSAPWGKSTRARPVLQGQIAANS